MEVLGYAAKSATSKMAPLPIQRRFPRNDDVVIDILYCGVCHSDLHTVRDDWGGTHYPAIPGHEIIGVITEVGSDVTKFKVGDHVGVGCMVDSCRDCEYCKQGLEQFCEGFVVTYDGIDRFDKTVTYGGYTENVVVAEDFVLKLPENLDLKGAAPLLCAGITTWSPLRHWKVNENSKVAVVGLGGLGHMAIKLAKGLGADVTLFSRSPNKKEDALKLGADRIVLSTEEDQMKAVRNNFDLIIDTVPYNHDLNPYVNTLAIDGTIVLVGYIGVLEDMVSTVPMVLGRKSIAGSVIGGIEETQEMLDFCGEHNITADIELINMQDINEAYERMLKSDVKYRFVIDMASLKEEARNR